MIRTIAHPHVAARSRLHHAIARSAAAVRRWATMPVRGQHVLWVLLTLVLIAYVVILVAVPTGVGRGGR